MPIRMILPAVMLLLPLASDGIQEKEEISMSDENVLLFEDFEGLENGSPPPGDWSPSRRV